MNRDGLHGVGAVGLGIGLALAGAWSLARPAYVEAQMLRDEAITLQSRITDVGDLATRRGERESELDRIRRGAAAEMKRIPAEPDVAGLMRRLSLPVDGESVLDQTFTAGVPRPAVDSEGSDATVGDPRSGGEQALPLTVDLVSRFDAAFALVRSTERLSRLVRVRAIRMAIADATADEAGAAAASPLVSASIDLEVVYDPTAFQGDGAGGGRP